MAMLTENDLCELHAKEGVELTAYVLEVHKYATANGFECDRAFTDRVLNTAHAIRRRERTPHFPLDVMVLTLALFNEDAMGKKVGMPEDSLKRLTTIGIHIPSGGQPCPTP
jgi:hypothetical protein